MTTRQTMFAVLALVATAAALPLPAGAQDGNFNRRTVLTFSKPFEIPGMVLPAGTYTFQLADTLADRHIVSISSADGSKQIAMAMGIAIDRIESTSKTVITFGEVPVGSPDTIRTWFYPGRSSGVEFVYPKRRALELASTARVIVPAIAVDVPEPDLRTVPLVAITPERQEVPVAAAVQAAPQQPERTLAVAEPRQLSRTADTLYLWTVLGLMSIGVAGLLLSIRRRRVAAAALPL